MSVRTYDGGLHVHYARILPNPLRVGRCSHEQYVQADLSIDARSLCVKTHALKILNAQTRDFFTAEKLLLSRVLGGWRHPQSLMGGIRLLRPAAFSPSAVFLIPTASFRTPSIRTPTVSTSTMLFSTHCRRL